MAKTTCMAAVAAALAVTAAGGAHAQTSQTGQTSQTTVTVQQPGATQTVQVQQQQPAGTMQSPVIVQLHPEVGQMPTTVAMSGPRVIDDYEEGDPIPQGYHSETRVRKGLVIGGAVPFGVFYLFSAMTAAIAHDANQNDPTATSDDALFIPAVGPFVQLAKSDSYTAKFFCGLDGVVQTLGLAMAIYGLASPKTVLVRNDLGKNKIELHPAPFMGRNGGGMGLVGTF